MTRASIILGIAALLIAVSVPSGAVIYVKTDGSDYNNGTSWATAKRTVQGGVNAAAAVTGGDEVWVKAGTYNENVTMKSGVDIYGGFDGAETMRSERDPETNVTIIDGRSKNSVLKAVGLKLAVTIDGFTLRNGKTTYGGIIYCKSCTMTVSQNVITQGIATYRGGGIYAQQCVITVEDCTISNNNARFRGGGIEATHSNVEIVNNEVLENISQVGAGVSVEYDSTGLVQFNNVHNNNAGISGGGGGIFIGWRAVPEVLDNIVAENLAKYGAGIYIYYSNAVFASNLVRDNVATQIGAGYLIAGIAKPTIVCDTVVSNDAELGGGFAVQYKSEPVIVNTIISLNNADEGGAVYYDTNADPSFSYCDFFSNGANQFYPVAFDPVGVDNNIDDDPTFVDPLTSDYHLDTGSPCIDAGDDGYIEPDWVDLDGNDRIQGGSVDMGCYETEEA